MRHGAPESIHLLGLPFVSEPLSCSAGPDTSGLKRGYPLDALEMGTPEFLDQALHFNRLPWGFAGLVPASRDMS